MSFPQEEAKPPVLVPCFPTGGQPASQVAGSRLWGLRWLPADRDVGSGLPHPPAAHSGRRPPLTPPPLGTISGSQRAPRAWGTRANMSLILKRSTGRVWTTACPWAPARAVPSGCRESRWGGEWASAGEAAPFQLAPGSQHPPPRAGLCLQQGQPARRARLCPPLGGLSVGWFCAGEPAGASEPRQPGLARPGCEWPPPSSHTAALGDTQGEARPGARGAESTCDCLGGRAPRGSRRQARQVDHAPTPQGLT